MLKGAEAPCVSPNGEYVERQGLAAYLAHGYVPFDLDTNQRNANSLFGSPEAVWASAATSLEYALDDFSIAQFAARALHDRAAYRRFMRRSGNWRNLFDRSSGQVEPRYENGAFPANYDNLGGGGFVEGDSVQYTWMVPHDPRGLFRRLGGTVKASERLGAFLRRLNGATGATHTAHALLGNEPTLNAPWLFDWARRPYATQRAVRRGLRLYSTAPDGYPGNDDLGTLSAWYVFGALGLYPEVPGVGLLAIGSPLFGHASIAMPHRRRVTIDASAFAFRRAHGKRGKRRRVRLSPAAAPYIRSLSLAGHTYGQPWTTYCALARGMDLSFQLGPHPDRGWGDSAAAVPPSFGPRHRMPKDLCTP
jgi:predicted alpha-1,2-mannosidase